MSMPRTAHECDAKSLPQDVETCHAIINDLTSQMQRLEHRLQLLLRQRFGPSAERVHPDQLHLFSEGERPAETPEPEPEPSAVQGHTRRNGRRKLPGTLPRITHVYELSELERKCPCCGEDRREIGDERSEQLEYEPAKVHVIEHVRKKYACAKCEGEVVTAPKPASAIEKGLAGPGLLAQVAIGKYADHLPLHRLERIFKRHGIEIPRSTMCDWMRQSADVLVPLYDLMRQEVLLSKVIHSDDTPVPVQEKGRGSTRQGRFWVYVGDDLHRYALFDYTPDRTGERPQELLKGFEGYLQADAYAGYDALYASGAVMSVGCWAHARRKFYDARLTDPGRCHKAMAMIKGLYKVEREGRNDELNHEALGELRQQRSVPLLGEFKEWLDENSEHVLPKSPVAQAIHYVHSRWDVFTRYTTNGILAIDNNVSENALRAVALGRKNWLFAGSDRGGRTAAVMFTMIASCRLNDVEPWSWMRDTLDRIATVTVSGLRNLLPDRWLASRGGQTDQGHDPTA